MSMSKRDKRKSEVLIAAQSLDQEIKHVKNLKRLSIGSMDLLMDPEMEFRVSIRQGSSQDHEYQASHRRQRISGHSDQWVNGAQPTEKEHEFIDMSKNDPNVSEDSSASAEVEDGDDSYSFTDDSMDVTNAEYLDKELQSNMANNTYQKQALPKRRMLSGSHSTSNESLSRSVSGGSDEFNPNESLGQNLLWVRADQHPNVKPENYLELVQNTLQNLNLDDRVSTSNEAQAQSLADLKRMRRRSLQSKNSLSRRPSRLRTSYTELSEDEENLEENNHQSPTVPFAQPRRTISLKDITEELTKLSNQAGLTDTDAVTLARTLGVPDASSDESIRQRSSTGGNITDEEEEFASTMLIKDGFKVPTRHSLRRSKFNTYRIESSSSQKEDELAIKPKSPPIRNSHSVANSPDSIIGMYHDDPYVGENKPLVQEFFSTLPANDEIESASSTEEGDSSTDFSNDYSGDLDQGLQSKHVDTSNNWKWSQNLTTSTDYQKAQVIPKENISPRKINHSRNRHSGNIPETGRSTSETSILSAVSAGVMSTKSPNNSSLNLGELSQADKEESTNKDSKVSSHDYDKPLPDIDHKKHKKGTSSQNKFIKFFKKRTSSSEDQPLKENQNNANTIQAPILKERDIRKKKSSSGLSAKFRISPKKLPKKDNQKHEQLNKEDIIKIDYDKGQQNPQRRPSLQPAVTVVKNAGNLNGLGDVTYENANKGPSTGKHSNWNTRTGRGSYDDEVEITEYSVNDESFNSMNSGNSAASGKDVFQVGREQNNADNSVTPGSSSASSARALESSETTPQQQRNQDDPAGITEQDYPLPPRKLTFADVKKPDRPNAPMKFKDSAFGFPLPPLTIATVIMFDHRLPIHVERAIYRLSHLKLSDPKRVLRQQVLLSNFMYAYLNLVNHSLYLQQLEEEKMGGNVDGRTGNIIMDIPDI